MMSNPSNYTVNCIIKIKSEKFQELWDFAIPSYNAYGSADRSGLVTTGDIPESRNFYLENNTFGYGNSRIIHTIDNLEDMKEYGHKVIIKEYTKDDTKTKYLRGKQIQIIL
jgi:hypothetical protein